MTSRPTEYIDEEAGDLMDLEDVSDSEHIHDSIEHTEDVNEDNLEQSTILEEPIVPNLLMD